MSMMQTYVNMMLARRRNNQWDCVYTVETSASGTEYGFEYSYGSANNKVDWGDGTVESLPYSTSNRTQSHTYANAGQYVVKVKMEGIRYFRIGKTNAYAKLVKNLTKCKLPSSFTNASSLFQGCGSLTSLPSSFSLPSGVTNAGYMFQGCSSLTSLPSSFSLPSGVTNVWYMFSSCSSLTSLPSSFSLPSGVTNAGYMFSSCSSLTSLPSSFSLPSGVTNVGNMFQGCSSLTSLPSSFSLPSGVTNTSHMFAGCSSLVSFPDGFTLSPNVTNVNFMFEGCSSLASLPDGFTFPSNLNSIGSMFRYCSALTSLPSSFSLPSGVTNVGNMFQGCSSLTSLPSSFSLPSGVTNTSHMFAGCSSLVSFPDGFTLPNGLNNAVSMFYQCGALASLPSDFWGSGFTSASINVNNMFTRCTSLTGTIPASLLWLNTNITWTSTNCFSQCTKLSNYATPLPDGGIPTSWGGMGYDVQKGFLHLYNNNPAVSLNATVPGYGTYLVNGGSTVPVEVAAGSYLITASPSESIESIVPNPAVVTANNITTVTIQVACLVKGTLITLADGTQKAVEDIDYTDELLVWDFDNGCQSTARPIWVKKPETASFYYQNIYADGRKLETTGSYGNAHRHFNAYFNTFHYTNTTVGYPIRTIDGEVIHKSCKRIDAPCEYYNIITERHFNLYANGILTSCSLNNLYPIHDMKYSKVYKPLHEEWYDGLPERYIRGLRLLEQPANKRAYVENLIRLAKEA